MWIVLLIMLACVLAFLFLPQFKGYRTNIVTWAGTIGLGGVLPYAADWFTYLNGLDWRQYVDARYAPAVMIGIGLVYLYLRRKTTAPVGEK